MGEEYYGECPVCGSNDIWDEFVSSDILKAGQNDPHPTLRENYMCTCQDCGAEFEVGHLYDFDYVEDKEHREFPTIKDVTCPRCWDVKMEPDNLYWKDRDGWVENHYECECPECGCSIIAWEYWRDVGSLIEQIFEPDASIKTNIRRR